MVRKQWYWWCSCTPTLPIFTDFYRFFGLSCRCVTKCAIHQLVCQVYYSLVSIPPAPKQYPLPAVLFLLYRFLPIFTDFSDFLVGVLPGVLFTGQSAKCSIHQLAYPPPPPLALPPLLLVIFWILVIFTEFFRFLPSFLVLSSQWYYCHSGTGGAVALVPGTRY